MARREMVRTGLTLERDILDTVKSIALELGCRVPTGPYTGDGSVAEMLRRIASGDLVVYRPGGGSAVGDLDSIYHASIDALLRMREAGVAIDLPPRERIPADFVARYDKAMAMVAGEDVRD